MDRRSMLTALVGTTIATSACTPNGSGTPSPSPSAPPRSWSGDLALTDAWDPSKANLRRLEVSGDHVLDLMSKKERTLTDDDARRLDEMLVNMPPNTPLASARFNAASRTAVFKADDGTEVRRSTTDQKSELWARIGDLYDLLKID